MDTKLSPPTQDTDLIARCTEGDREAFAILVARYQSLVCAQAYSICGDFTRSEDIAQDTFLSAWRQLPQLREPAKFKAWICGIARHLALRVAEKKQREGQIPVGDPAAADCTHELVAAREEEAIVWHALEQLPETYRSVLVLYYREQQSIAAVAQAMDMTEEAVRQRLSRGRAMLKQQVATVVETSLTRTRPGAAFTLAVMATLPLAIPATASAGTLAAAAKAGITGGASLLPILLGLLGGVLGALGGWFGVKVSAEAAAYERERKYIYRSARRMTWVIAAFLVVEFAGIYLLVRGGRSVPVGWMVAGAIGFVGAYVCWLLRAIVRTNRDLFKIRQEEKAAGTPRRKPAGGWAQMTIQTGREYRSPRSFLGLPLIHMRWSSGDVPFWKRQPAIGWIAFGDRPIGVIAFGTIPIGVLSFGAVAVGLFATGGMAIGALTYAGLALGVFSFGGVAIGWEAYGGLAVAIHAAFGGLAAARDFALGGVATAAQANTPLAQAAMESSPWLRWAKSQWFSPVAMAFTFVMLGIMLWVNSRLQPLSKETEQ